jgi:hypothetical protein
MGYRAEHPGDRAADPGGHPGTEVPVAPPDDPGPAGGRARSRESDPHEPVAPGSPGGLTGRTPPATACPQVVIRSAGRSRAAGPGSGGRTQSWASRHGGGPPQRRCPAALAGLRLDSAVYERSCHERRELCRQHREHRVALPTYRFAGLYEGPPGYSRLSCILLEVGSMIPSFPETSAAVSTFCLPPDRCRR